MTLFTLLHLLAVLIWVGGMFFAHFVLRPSAEETLGPPERLRLLNAVFRRFFNWVWGVVGIILITGLYLIYLYGGIIHTTRAVQIMTATGLTMSAIFIYIFFACYLPFSLHVAKQQWKEAGGRLPKIRRLVAFNLAMGLLTVCVATIGAAWG